VPSASGTIPAATAAADPLLEPPGVCPGARGFRVGPGAITANSAVTVLPATSTPAASSRLTTVACGPARTSAGTPEPALVGRPSTRMTSLMPVTSPYSAGWPAATADRACRSLAAASSRARRPGSGTNAWMPGSARSIRSHAAAAVAAR